MSNFEFVFSLFGLLLGLSLAEVLAGFGRALKARARVRIGWLVPLLGVLVMLDLTSFWTAAWGFRDQIPVNYLTLMLLLLLTGAYYLAATLVFPDQPDDLPDFDAHYWANKRLVLGAMLLLNMPNYALDWWLGTGPFLATSFSVVVSTLFILLLAFAIPARGKPLNLALLGGIIFLYPLNSAVGVLLRNGMIG